MSIPFERLEAVFLDAGNTIFAMDYALMAQQLVPLGFTCTQEALARAEAAARPAVSRRIASGESTETQETLVFYMARTLEALLDLDETELEQLADHWVTALRRPGVRERIWKQVAPGVPDALALLSRAGLKLVVVSNSDGTIESAVRSAGLAAHIHGVVDSHIVGVQKPDPRIFEHALALSRSEPTRTLHVGDLYAVDVVGARSAGLHAALLDPYGDWDGVDCERAQDLLELARRISDGR